MSHELVDEDANLCSSEDSKDESEEKIEDPVKEQGLTEEDLAMRRHRVQEGEGHMENIVTRTNKRIETSEPKLLCASFAGSFVTRRHLSNALTLKPETLFVVNPNEIEGISHDPNAQKQFTTLTQRSLVLLNPPSGGTLRYMWDTAGHVGHCGTSGTLGNRWDIGEQVGHCGMFGPTVYLSESVLVTTLVDPLPGWLLGIQLVGIPRPVKGGIGALLNSALFARSGNCGYLQKPKALVSTPADPVRTTAIEAPMDLSIRVRKKVGILYTILIRLNYF